MSDQHRDEPSVPDDVWERFARDTERDIRASAPKEPSARARMVTARLREQEARGVRPESWRAAPAAPSRARRRGAWTALGLVLAVVMAVVAMKPSLLPGHPFGARSGKDADTATGLPAETAPPTAPPSAAPPDTPTPERPFAGSPAADWADGAAGIVLPKAEPVGVFSRQQVAHALQQSRTLLVDANLDPGTLRGERPAAALAVVDPLQPDMLDRLNASLRAPDEKHDPLSLFSRFDPKEVRLVGDVVKTRGRMSFAEADHGSVVVHADYTFVYPLARPGTKEVARTIVRRVLELELPNPARFRVTAGKLTVLRDDEDAGNSACDVHDGYLHPEFPSQQPTGTPPSGPSFDPYDRSEDLDRRQSCGTVTRT
ncbi:hypothetical protein ACFYZE_14670 [Streptomyces sp. NPDC001796]|uniref:hypothetical protein n=1 Tax=Streptomyces sp. NPDC001796 TaxID=3364609 RepID=UPI00369F1ED9